MSRLGLRVYLQKTILSVVEMGAYLMRSPSLHWISSLLCATQHSSHSTRSIVIQYTSQRVAIISGLLYRPLGLLHM